MLKCALDAEEKKKNAKREFGRQNVEKEIKDLTSSITVDEVKKKCNV